MSKKVELICGVCGVEFTRYPSQLRTIGKSRVCSTSCRNKLAWRAHTEAMISTFEVRFWSKVVKGDGCWIWTGSFMRKGYGTVGYKGKTKLAHRMAYILSYGEFPDELCVLHKCDNPKCVRPDHLFLGSRRDNSDDMIRKGRDKHQSGEINGRCKISDKQVSEIRELYSTGEWTQAQLGVKYGVGQTQVSKHVRGAAR